MFESIKEQYSCNSVLYPGCSIHITPSFYFQHVVYDDISKVAREYFDDYSNMLSIVNENKKYKPSAYIQFINNDYTKQLPIRENNYDLLIAIYAEAVTTSCKKYVRPGGIIISNNHRRDAQEALMDSSVILEALIRKKGKKYLVEESTNKKLHEILKEYSIPLKNMRDSSNGVGFVDNEYYFVLRKLY